VDVVGEFLGVTGGQACEAAHVLAHFLIAPEGKVKIMDGERVAFTEEGQPGQYLKLVASGEVDDTMLEALEDYVKRQRKRLAASGGGGGGDTLGNG